MDKCQECPYDGKDCFKRLKTDALALLKAQEPREMSNAELMDAIRKAPIMMKPAVDAVPVVHARWIKPVPGDGEAYCSNCKHDALPCGYYLNPALMKYYETTYCPWCGARMDGRMCNG